MLDIRMTRDPEQEKEREWDLSQVAEVCDALADLSVDVSDGDFEMGIVIDAITDLSADVSTLFEIIAGGDE